MLNAIQILVLLCLLVALVDLIFGAKILSPIAGFRWEWPDFLYRYRFQQLRQEVFKRFDERNEHLTQLEIKIKDSQAFAHALELVFKQMEKKLREEDLKLSTIKDWIAQCTPTIRLEERTKEIYDRVQFLEKGFLELTKGRKRSHHKKKFKS
jgi:hypothetical protein